MEGYTPTPIDQILNQDQGSGTPLQGSVAQNYQPTPIDDIFKQSAEEDPFGGVKAAAAGVGRGLSFGLSDLALTQTGLVEPETLKSLKEAYPTTSTLSEIGGVVGPALLSGGTSLLAGGARIAGTGVRAVSAIGEKVAAATAKKLVQEAGKSTAKKVLGKAIAAGLGSAVEGGFYGAGQFISDSALGDPNVNAEKFFSQVGMSALLGGAFGSTFNIAGQGLKAAANNYKSIAKSAYSKINNLDDDVLNYVVKNSQKIDDIYKAPGTKVDKIKTTVTNSLDDYFSKYSQFSDDFGNNFKDTISKLNSENKAVPLKDLLNDVDNQISDLVGSKGLGAPSAKKAAKALQSYKEELVAAATQNAKTSNFADDLLKDFSNFSGSKKDYRKLMSKISGNPDLAGKLYLTPDDLVSVYRASNEQAKALGLYSWRVDTKPGAYQWSQLGNKARSLLGDLDEQGAIKTWNTKYGSIAKARDELKKYGFKGDFERLPEFEDKMTSLLTSGTKDAKKASKWLKVLDSELGSDLKGTQELLTAYDKLTSGKFAAITTGYSTLLPALSAITGIGFGLPAPIVAAGTLGAAALQAPILRRPIIEGAAKVGPSIDKTFNILTKTGQSVPPELVPFISAKIAGLAEVERKTKRADQDTAGAVTQFLNNHQQFNIESREPKTKKTYIETFKDYQDLISDDLKFNEYMDEQFQDLGFIYPSIVEPLKGKTKQSINYLLKDAPKVVQNDDMFSEPLEPSDMEISKFKIRHEVVEDPRVVLKALKNETLSKIHVETLQQIYPAIYEGMRMAFVNDAHNARSKLSYHQKLQMSMLFNVQGLPSLKQGSFALLQDNFKPDNKETPVTRGGATGLKDYAKSTMTEAQKTYS